MNCQLLEGISLLVTINDQPYFSSTGKWLYPLFELEDHLKNHPIDFSQAAVLDKVVGKAAALFLIHLGAEKVHGELMSELAVNTLKDFHIPYSFHTLVPRIDCKTEALLLLINDPETAYQLLSERANR